MELDLKTNNLLLATHRGFASGIYSALSLILGDTDAVKTVEVDVDDAMDLVCFRIDDALRSFPSDQPILLVTDIPGGSPTQAALREAPLFPNAICITGLNLGMLLELATMPLDGANLQDAKTIAKEAVRSSLNSIGLLEDIAASVDRTLTDDAESEEL